VDEKLRALEVGQELVSEPMTLAGTLDQSGHVGDRELAPVRAVDRADHRRECGERVVRHLGLGVRDAAQERGLAGVRKPG